MTRSSLFLIIFALLVTSFVVTGFQCGSTDVTSAKLYIQRNDYTAAEKSLLKAVQKNPADGEAWYLLGFSQLQIRKFDEMLKSFDQCLKASNEYKEKVHQARLSAWGQLFNEALVFHNQMAKVSKDSVSLLGQKAIEKYNLSATCNADSPATYQNLAAVYAIMKDYDKEIVNLKKVQAISKQASNERDVVNAYLQKADALREKNDKAASDKAYQEALDELNSARMASPNDKELLQLTIDIYIQLGRAKEAMPLMDEAVKQDPMNKTLQNNLGILMMQSDDLQGAIEHFNASIALDSSFQDAIRNLGVVYLKMGDKMKQEAQAKADPKKKEQDIDKSYLEQFKLAAKVLEHLVYVKPDNSDFWDALATAYANVGSSKQAQKAITFSDAVRGGNISIGMAESELEKTFGKFDKNTPGQYKDQNATLYTYTSKGLNIFIADGKVLGWTISQSK